MKILQAVLNSRCPESSKSISSLLVYAEGKMIMKEKLCAIYTFVMVLSQFYPNSNPNSNPNPNPNPKPNPRSIPKMTKNDRFCTWAELSPGPN